jgi:chemotaxis protein histidine kinase CheA
VNVTTCPQFSELDRDIIDDFSECLRENIDAIEDCINLLDTENEVDLIHRLFRDMHSFKGNCRMVQLDPVAEPIHALEEIVSDMRQGNRIYTSFYGEFFMSIILHIEAMIQSLSTTGEIIGKPQDEMLNLINTVLAAKDGQDHQAVNKALDILAGAEPSNEVLTQPEPTSDTNNFPEPEPISEEFLTGAASDLAFFKALSLQLDALGIYKLGRTESLLEICLSTNEKIETPVCSVQLSAAIYLHDIGMALVPRNILEKQSKLSASEFNTIQCHINMGAQILQKVPNWQLASEIVNQHHEKFNGQGYPKGVSGANIQPGAMIIALADTFYSLTNERIDRKSKKSIFSAVSLINGESGEQFDPVFVEAFNETIRQRYVKR